MAHPARRAERVDHNCRGLVPHPSSLGAGFLAEGPGTGIILALNLGCGLLVVGSTRIKGRGR